MSISGKANHVSNETEIVEALLARIDGQIVAEKMKIGYVLVDPLDLRSLVEFARSGLRTIKLLTDIEAHVAGMGQPGRLAEPFRPSNYAAGQALRKRVQAELAAHGRQS